MDEDALRAELDGLHEIVVLLTEAVANQGESIDAIGTAVQKLGGPIAREDGLDSSLN